MSTNLGGTPPRPFIQNHVIDVAGDDATGRCGVEIRMVDKGEAYTVAGHYFDSYRRIDGAWRFAAKGLPRLPLGPPGPRLGVSEANRPSGEERTHQ
jgi:hypothetical protein